MLNDPPGIDPHVIWHHVGREPDAALDRPLLQIGHGRLAAKVRGDLVVVDGVGRSGGVRLTHALLEAARGGTALPDADQP